MRCPKTLSAILSPRHARDGRREGFVRGAAFFSTVDIGTTIAGKYVLTRKLGEGGMGAVYEAEHTLIGRRFAVKATASGACMSG